MICTFLNYLFQVVTGKAGGTPLLSDNEGIPGQVKSCREGSQDISQKPAPATLSACLDTL